MGGQALSVSATWMQDTTLPWLAYELSHSPVAVGWLAFCRYVPFAVFGMSSGVVADRFDNRKLVVAVQLASMAIATALAILALTGLMELWHLYVFAVLGGTAAVFDWPSRSALTLQLVRPDQLSNAVALNSSLTNAARVVGPAAAGVIIAVMGAGVCFLLNAASYLPFIATVLAVHPARLVSHGRPTAFGGARDGFAYALRDPEIRLILGLIATIAIFGFNIRVLLPVLSSDTLGAGPEVFGILFGCFGVGAVVGGVVAASQARATWTAVLLGAGGLSVVNLLLGPLEVVWGAAVLLAALGACHSVWTSNSQSLLVLAGPRHMRGRMLALFLMAFGGVAPLGSLLTGWLAAIGGTALAFLVAGLAGIVVTAYAALRLRTVRARSTRDDPRRRSGQSPRSAPPPRAPRAPAG